MAFTSFKQGSLTRPRAYRTPSPPLHDIELLSPYTSRAATASHRHRESLGNVTAEAPSTCARPSRVTNYGQRDDIQRGAMDTFASIALAANTHDPQRVSHSRIAQGSKFERQEYAERPTKRARSEKLRSSSWRHAESRPVTSYAPQSTDPQRVEEAELLLQFSRGACLAVPKTPLLQQRFLPVSSNISPTGATQQHTLENLSHGTSFTQTQNAPEHHVRTGSVALAAVVALPMQPVSENEAQSDLMPLANDDQPTTASAESCRKDIIAGYSIPQQDGEILNEIDPEPGKQAVLSSSSDQSNDKASDLFTRPPNSALKTPEKIPTGSEALLGAKIKSGSELEIPANDFLAGIEEAARLGNESEQLANSSPKTAEKSTLDPVRDLSKEVSTDAPAVCASCNFARNLLTIETENNATSWISCDGCKCWFHFACAGFKSEREVRAVDKYRCRKCKPLHGPTTYVRKSARAHSAIDYAGLHQGVLKTSDENPEHHYIKPIKDGIIKFNPENFARMQPELVTADYFQKGDGMKEPIVIPASMNPRPKPISNLDVTEIAKGETNSLQTVGVPDGPNDQSVLDKWLSQYFEYEAVPNHGQDALDMVIPQNLTVRMVSELYGPEEKVEVIDVKSQNGEDKKWNMRRWVDYYESKGNKVVRNVISLEVSQSKLGRLIRRPKIVRDLDLQDHVWPVELQAKGDYPKVQFYCLMSVADCFTDFHIDFGGSSVFYHILKGKKTFFFIPPHDRHLKKYEEWCMSPAQNWTFLGDQTKECYRVDLSEGDTMLIPAGWIHAVWTPEDSLVIGGNFLTPMHYQMQIRIAQIEKATGVARKFRYPHFQKLLWYAALYYLEDDPLPDSVTESLLSGQIFHREIPTHLDFHAWGDRSNPGTENYHSRYYSKHELDGLPELGRYLQRTALIAMGNITDGISVETRNAVKRSIPKGQGEPLEVVKKFAIWYTWKRGNEPIPHWAYPNHVPEGGAPELTEKKLSAAALKRLDREAALQAWRVAPDRQSTRRKSHPQNVFVELVNGEEIVGESQSGVSKTSSPAPTSDYKLSLKRKQESQQLPPVTTPVKRRKTEGGLVSSLNRKPACESCRKRRRACKHKEDPSFKYSLGSDTVEDSITIDSNHFLDHQMIPIQPDMNRCSMQNSSNEGHSTDDSGHQNRRSDESQESTHVDSAQEGQHQHSMNGLLQASPSPTAMDASWPSLMDNSLNVTIITPLKPGSRTKACSECRKSKRRCVHDEAGNEDPIKVAEAAIPRPSTFKKRKATGESIESASAKKARKSAQPYSITDANSVLDPQLLDPQLFDLQPNTPTPVGMMPDNMLASDLGYIPSNAGPGLELLGHRNSDCMEPSENQETACGLSRDAELSTQPPLSNIEDEVHLISTSPLSDMKVEPDFETPILSSSQMFPQPPGSSLVSPPASTHTDGEQSPPASSKAKGITPPATSMSSRQSSRPVKLGQRYTPESGPARSASSSSVGRPAVERESGSPGSVGAERVNKKGKSRVGSEIEAEEESMKLIRELQAQDMGLRRRGRA